MVKDQTCYGIFLLVTFPNLNSFLPFYVGHFGFWVVLRKAPNRRIAFLFHFVFWAKMVFRWECLQTDNHSERTIKFDIGQHSQFLRCFQCDAIWRVCFPKQGVGRSLGTVHQVKWWPPSLLFFLFKNIFVQIFNFTNNGFPFFFEKNSITVLAMLAVFCIFKSNSIHFLIVIQTAINLRTIYPTPWSISSVFVSGQNYISK